MLVLLCASCAPSLFRAPRTGPLPPDRVVLFGTAEFDPPLSPGRHGPDPRGFLSNIIVGFTQAPDRPVDLDRMRHGLDGYTLAPPDGSTFAVEAPQGPIFVRALSLFVGARSGGTYFSGGYVQHQIVHEHVRCYDRLEVTLEPADRYAYIGALVCRHVDGAPVRIDVVDRFTETGPTLATSEGAMPIARRLARRVE
jgi:hypothetical protein